MIFEAGKPGAVICTGFVLYLYTFMHIFWIPDF